MIALNDSTMRFRNGLMYVELSRQIVWQEAVVGVSYQHDSISLNEGDYYGSQLEQSRTLYYVEQRTAGRPEAATKAS